MIWVCGIGAFLIAGAGVLIRWLVKTRAESKLHHMYTLRAFKNEQDLRQAEATHRDAMEKRLLQQADLLRRMDNGELRTGERNALRAGVFATTGPSDDK